MNTTAQIKSNLKKSAKQIRQEPLEVLKTATRQISGEEEILQETQTPSPNYQNDVGFQQAEQLKQQIAVADNKNLEALQSEMRDIRRQKLFNRLLARIQAGEDVPVEQFGELSHEQRDVLKARLEASKRQRVQQQAEQGLIEPSVKKGRRFGGFGKRKSQAEKQQTRVEMPLPPSG